MKIAVFIKLVPDLVEELEIDQDGRKLDTTWLRFVINEFDDHALEQAILLKEKYSAEVIAIAPDFEGVDELLFTAYAKGADKAIKLTGDFETMNNHSLSRSISTLMESIQPDLILTGVQANNDLDGPIGPLIAGCLNQPFVGYVSGIKLTDTEAKVQKEYPGGVISEMSISFPSVLGIQSAETPPRYVAVSKVRQVMKSATIEEQSLGVSDNSGYPEIARMFHPEISSQVQMITGSPSEIVDKLVIVLKDKGII